MNKKLAFYILKRVLLGILTYLLVVTVTFWIMQGNYDVARNGWVADYDDPSTFLSMWTTASGNNDSQFGKGAHASAAVYEADLNGNGTIEDNEKNLTWHNPMINY